MEVTSVVEVVKETRFAYNPLTRLRPVSLRGIPVSSKRKQLIFSRACHHNEPYPTAIKLEKIKKRFD